MSTEGGLPDSVQRSKCRLQRRIEEVKTTRKDVLAGFEQKIDSIISKPIKAAEYLMSNLNVPSDDLSAASLQLSNCSEFIWGLLIKVCEMIEKHQVLSPQICMGFNELTPPPQGLYICSIPAAAINLNYVQIESQNEISVEMSKCQSSGHPTVKNGIVNGRELSLEESNTRVGEIMNDTKGNVEMSAIGGEVDQNDVAIDENEVPVSPASPVSQHQLNGSFVNSLLMSDSDSSFLAHDTTQVISQKSLAVNDQNQKPASNLNHQHHQQQESSGSNVCDARLCHNKQVIRHGKTLSGAHQYESDGSNSSRKIAISDQDSQIENSSSHFEHGSGRDIGLCHNTLVIRHDKTLVGAHQYKQNGCDSNRKSTSSCQDSLHENPQHDQSQLESAARNKSELCESIRKNTISIQDLAIANSGLTHSHQVYSSDESQRAIALDHFNPESGDIDLKIEPSSETTQTMIVNLKLDDEEVYLSGESTTMPVNTNHTNGGEYDQTRSDSCNPLGQINESAFGASHFQCKYQSDLESETETVNLSSDTANPSASHTQVTDADSVEKNQFKPAIKECLMSNSQRSCQAISKNESEFEFIGIISDIATPSSFSIQRKSDLQQLDILGYNLNKYFNYPERIDQGLRMQSAPLEGDSIAAQYTVDGNWYRGLVLQVTGIHTVIVRYIDYGNTDEILWQKAFKLPTLYQDIPSVSIKCSLAGIRPLQSEKGNGDGIRIWDEHALKWFDEVMLNKTVSVIPVHKTSQLLHVQLFTNRELTGSSECISDVMVEFGLAQYDIEEDDDVVIPAVTEVSQYDQINQPIRSSQPNDSVSQTDPKRPITNSPNFKNDRNEECPNLSSNSPTITSNMQKNEKNNESMPDDLGSWNPLVEDFQSGSNSYEIDNENACVMVEGYDPEKVPICKYYMERKCWSGHRCRNLHPSPSKSGEVKFQIPTFSGADISPLPLKEGDWCIARVTNVDEADNFYVHIVQVLGNKNDCLKITESLMNCVISKELVRQSYDMSKYCNFAARRMKNRLRPVIGEVYIVLANEVTSYHRGMVIESELVNTTQQHVSVHLIDLGKNTVVQDRFLYPMSPTFMHLPKQALHCTLWNSNPGKHELMLKIARSANCQNVVMEVNEVCDRADGPVAVTLYDVISNRLERLT